MGPTTNPTSMRHAMHRCLVAFTVLLIAPRIADAQLRDTSLRESSVKATASTPDGAPLAWMAGCWEQRTPRRIVQELWLPPASGTMIGMGRTLRHTAAGDSLVEMEFLRIVARDGAWAYLAQPGGQPPTEFTSHAAGDTSVTFTNLQHDFPQQITYRRRGADSLVARVEGVVNGATRAIEFPYARGACW
jgi:hypothetical protein